jgi:tetratricopeptide (TPR) repeat protein
MYACMKEIRHHINIHSLVVIFSAFLSICFLAGLSSCVQKKLPNQEMIDLLQQAAETEKNHQNMFNPEAIILFCDSIIKASSDPEVVQSAWARKANAYMSMGAEPKAITILEKLMSQLSPFDVEKRRECMKNLALAYLRDGERTNCVNNHGAESCIYPISLAGVHANKNGSVKAIELYNKILEENPRDLESRWLLNLAYMTIGAYPDKVPPQFLLKVDDDDSLQTIQPFKDVAANVGLNTRSMGGGSIIDDFNNDGLLDFIYGSWSLEERIEFCRNNGNGTFTDVSDSSNLGYMAAGLNMMQVDYNNDGWKDVFILRGAWKKQFGKAPNSLLRNNGNGTFTDITKESGLLSFHPTQAATWADFNNDGWLDLFIGNETLPDGEVHTCQFYINNKNGTFTEQAAAANCAINAFVKGVTSGDYDNDGLTDLFLSTMNGNKILLKNSLTANGKVQFTDVTEKAGLASNKVRTFPTWFWDYDNDGWLDILVCGYDYYESLSYCAAAESLNMPIPLAGYIYLFRNKQDGTFEDVSVSTGVHKIAFAMGANFGDIDNDGYLDFYLGTGNPNLTSAIPNKLFKNLGGKRFLDVTTSARVGNLQKGHGVSFADMDNDGDEDIYIKMGGAFTGDGYESSLYLNPGQNANQWVNLLLEGTTSNKGAVGAKIKVTFTENGVTRSVYRDVNSGGSFGSSPLRQHIGIGTATAIDRIEIKWPVTGKVQVFEKPPLNTNIRIKENNAAISTYQLPKVDYYKIRSGLLACKMPEK